MEEAADLVVRYGGSLSGEHGDGQARAELLPKMFGPEIVEAFREFKSVWDPRWKMNPGKVVDPYKLDQNLRAGPDYHPRPVQTYFKFPEDHGSFAAATERCFGVGKCRGLDGDTMCPSFKATREEMHTTRERAHLLFEMMRGDVIADGWRFLFDEYLREIDYHPPKFERSALVHGQCHQKAVMGLKPTEEILSAMGVKAEVLDSGCCGMAGSFGYESATTTFP